jgi:PAS domain S-box-containing protein
MPEIAGAKHMEAKSKEEVLRENEELKERLREAEEVLRAIREGKVDALVSYGPEGERVYTLESADRGYRLLVESIQEGAVILAPDGSIYYSNPRFEEMVKREHWKIASSLMVEYVSQEDKGKFEALLREAGEGKPARGEIRLQDASGALLPVYVSMSPLDMEDFRGICVTLTDLTEQKLYIERLERSNCELQDFASIASHDLQEPLRKIQAFGERLKLKSADSLSPEGRDYVERMQSASKRMQGFIRELLNYSRVSTRAEPFRPVDLQGVLQDVTSDLQVRIDETGGQVEIGELPRLEADPSQMRQLFLNLIGNALKFHGNEKPVVKIHGNCPSKIEADSGEDAQRGRRFRIIVEDNGIGFDESDAERIFAPFHRLHGRSEYEGTGMGLAICKKIVERHGGSITARSAPGKGSTFIITLPLKQSREENL